MDSILPSRRDTKALLCAFNIVHMFWYLLNVCPHLSFHSVCISFLISILQYSWYIMPHILHMYIYEQHTDYEFTYVDA